MKDDVIIFLDQIVKMTMANSIIGNEKEVEWVKAIEYAIHVDGEIK
jgi:hypothetical protein